MKKTYLIPQTEVTEIRLLQMIASSPIKGNLNPDEEVDDPSEVGSRRRRNVWGEEEEENY